MKFLEEIKQLGQIDRQFIDQNVPKNDVEADANINDTEQYESICLDTVEPLPNFSSDREGMGGVTRQLGFNSVKLTQEQVEKMK